MVAYKLFKKRKNGSYGSIFIDKKKELKLDEWYDAELHETKGFLPRLGYHCLPTANVPHLSTKGRVWLKVEIKDYEILNRPASQGGKWLIAKKIKLLNEISK